MGFEALLGGPFEEGSAFEALLDRRTERTQKIMRTVDEPLPTVDRPLPLPEALSLETVRPRPEYVARLLRVRDELAARECRIGESSPASRRAGAPRRRGRDASDSPK